MTDNPLADWLRARQAALGEADEAQRLGSTSDAGDAGGAAELGGAEGIGAPDHPGAVCWDRPLQDDEPRPPQRRHRRLLLIAALPWTVAAVLGGVALMSGEADPAPVAAGDQGPGDPPAAGAADNPPHLPAPLDPALGAAAAVAVRLAVTTAGDTPDGQERRYVDLAVPESVSWAGDLAVVTIRAVVLEGPTDHWRSARPARFAVPVGVVDGDAVALDEPWALPVPDRPDPAPGWTPALTAPEPIAEAVTAAGYADADVVEVAAHSDHPTLLRARIQARAPGEQERRAHQLWLHTEPEPAVLGLEPSPGQDDGSRS